MYDLRASMLKKVLPKSMAWRTALILSQAGTQYSEYSRNKPEGADPRNDFPGFDLDKIAQDIKAHLGEDARGLRSKGEEYNEVLGHLWYLTTKKSYPGGHPIVAYRPDASTEERKVFTLGKIGDDLHRALENGGHYPFLLSVHSKTYWFSILVLGALQAGHVLTMSEIVSFTGLTPLQIQTSIDNFASGFTAKSSTGETREYVGRITEKQGKYRLPSDLVFANDTGADDLDKLELKVSPVLPPRTPEKIERAVEVASVIPKANGGLRVVEKTPQGVQISLRGEDASLILAEAKVRGISPEELAMDLLASRLAEIRPMLRNLAKHRENDSKSKLAAFEAEKSLLIAEHQAKLEELAKKMGFVSV